MRYATESKSEQVWTGYREKQYKQRDSKGLRAPGPQAPQEIGQQVYVWQFWKKEPSRPQRAYCQTSPGMLFQFRHDT